MILKCLKSNLGQMFNVEQRRDLKLFRSFKFIYNQLTVQINDY